MDIIELLAKIYRKYGFTSDEFVFLNSCLNQSGYRYGIIKFDEVSEMTGLESDEILNMLKELKEKKNVPFFDETSIDFNKLYKDLQRFEYSLRSLRDKLTESIGYYQMMGSYDEYGHMGMVELLPIDDEGGIAVATKDGYLWSIKETHELIEELKKFINYTDDEGIMEFNNKVKEKKEFESERWKEKAEHREEEKRKREIPKPGIVILFRMFPSGLYKITYSTSLSEIDKINRIKEEYGHNTEIVHVIETADTFKFVHQFIKKQFSNRMAGNGFTEYKLTDEDIEYIRSEVYPSNAMEWMNG
ncbi:hypothetical protein M4D76_16445 [Peribacillus frigoritolerans]|uniref:hypothetical protein n=1 Tax=Peribacillus frigoritolerans TaxID=450367 RepID=UPI0021A65277|nr:hypothetical protein [Peribacillus frigoritolerans]MCT1389887.1 hypothetical protein [Peribacillus frigoritolerans]